MAGRIFAITGASGILGTAVAKAAAASGARVALIDYAPSAAVADELGAEAFFQGNVDLTDAVQTQHRVIRLSDRNLRPIPVTVTPVTGGECAIDVHGSHVTVHRLPP